MTTDEQMLRAALTDAATGQPPAPYDRIDGVRRRHARRRQRQMVALGAAVVVAIAGTALGVIGVRVGTSNATPATHPKRPAWALQWPDRRDRSIPQSVLDGAVQSWAHDHPAGVTDGDTGSASEPVWYLGQRVADDEIAVAFEYSGGGAPYVVMGHATASAVMNGQPPYDANDGASSWVLYGVPAVYLDQRPVLGLNLAVRNPDAGFDDDIVVLTDPRARRLDFEFIGPDGRLSRANAPMTAGYAEVNTGPVRSRVKISAVRDARGNELAGGMYVGVPTTDSVSPTPDTPVLMQVPDFAGVPDTRFSFGSNSGQGTFVDSSSGMGVWPTRPTRIYARCYGGRSIKIAIDYDAPGHRVVVPCDDREHVVTGPAFMRHAVDFADKPDSHSVAITAGQLTAWRVAVVVP